MPNVQSRAVLCVLASACAGVGQPVARGPTTDGEAATRPNETPTSYYLRDRVIVVRELKWRDRNGLKRDCALAGDIQPELLAPILDLLRRKHDRPVDSTKRVKLEVRAGDYRDALKRIVILNYLADDSTKPLYQSAKPGIGVDMQRGQLLVRPRPGRLDVYCIRVQQTDPIHVDIWLSGLIVATR